jgi:multicomponent Na+:H+ antiporter subunit D
MALFPFHTWLPDAHSHAPPIVAALLASIQIEVSAYVVIRLFLNVFTPELMSNLLPITSIIGWAGAAGVIAGSLLAIAQTDFKRMLAYSTVSQIALIALGIGLANPLGIVGALLHIIAHALMKSCLFLVAGGVYYKMGIAKVDDYTGLGHRMPWTMSGFTIAALAMIGIPPTAGFFSKWYLALGSVDAGNWVFLTVILASSLLNAVYFFRVIEKVFSPPEAQEKQLPRLGDLPFQMLAPIGLFAIGIVVVGILNVVIVNQILMPVVQGL